MNLAKLKGKRFKEWFNWLLRTQDPQTILRVLRRLFPRYYWALEDAQVLKNRKEYVHKLAKRRDLRKLSLEEAMTILHFRQKGTRLYRLLLLYSDDRFPDNNLRRACRRWLKEWRNEVNK